MLKDPVGLGLNVEGSSEGGQMESSQLALHLSHDLTFSICKNRHHMPHGIKQGNRESAQHIMVIQKSLHFFFLAGRG